ncbi:HAMP domain-containing sensor histidine kinase [Rhodanobacter sp. MP7CTX1]|jgi:signal transduction histidine kinase|uniref:sensor histidine kinase n=1 Tax=Rhodanobacter sp. MP7CTX1 TaxID=2723084 RepID=UPI00161D378A|nr:HAMP domain-containing sensor histidine kinase [Rhodanobacter sp. MP7CTX1]MBB6189775.1 signal transduction histidine kinase [Rhodanobacter sp. MP7CTX1]
MKALRAAASRLRPRSMAARLYLILFAGVFVAHGLSFGLLFFERYESSKTMLLGSIELDVATAVALLDRVPAAERASWLPLLERRTYRYILGPGLGGGELSTGTSREITGLIASKLDGRFSWHANMVSTRSGRFQLHVRLHDGAPLTIDITPSILPIASWLPFVFAVQMTLLLLCALLAVRLATRPLARLARAAETLTLSGGATRLEEGGPTEVAFAIAAFNAMQERITEHLRERLQILAAISHDLQIPITRMALRIESMDDLPERDRLNGDLGVMQHLVRESVAYARSMHGSSEPPCRIDPDAFLDCLICDYQDAGKTVTLSGHVGKQVVTRPHALRRTVSNLLDNAIAYAGAAELTVQGGGRQPLLISVLDRGPGIPTHELEAVLQPFYRVEGSRSRETGGTGLGLAIVHQLSMVLGGELSLRNREGGGLEVELRLPPLSG